MLVLSIENCIYKCIRIIFNFNLILFGKNIFGELTIGENI